MKNVIPLLNVTVVFFFSFGFVTGLGDMAVSNTIGSNVFDILVGLGVPWAIQTMCVSYGSEVKSQFNFCFYYVRECTKQPADELLISLSCGLQVMINSRGLLYSVVLLLGSVALTVSNSS